MAYDNILLVPHGDDLTQPCIERVLSIAGADTSVEIFDPVFNSRLEAYPIARNEAYNRLKDHLVDTRRARAGKLAAELADKGINSSGMAAWDYPTSDAIVRRALSTETDLVITEPLNGRAGTLSQGDWRLISRCPLPLLLVRGNTTGAYQNIVAAIDPSHAHSKPRDLDDAILRTAVELQAATSAALRIVHCFSPLTYLVPGVSVERLPIDDTEQAFEDFRQEAVEAALSRAGLPMGSAELRKGKPGDVLQAMTESGEADLIVMGGLSRGRVRDFVLGNTAEHLVQHSHADLLILKPADFKTTVSKQIPESLTIAPVYYPF